ncbi:MAG: branched-chain amino acid ABC transporter permease [Simplicispira sp.]|uniref:branched-chain amino acid ABC transporter permease n=1 Tax=Simplicispira sp. TaxID=2015802 RepID=UPI00258AD6EA|nr:branched-chain amino acid ABC transporter permease [Simplicispira sp.]MDD2691671.1 branched-chain amino acid ABC transporter permease [Simplicispira sp.]
MGRFAVWALFALVLVASPLVFSSSLALTMLSQMGYLILICLSYNILLGQGGMLSFGHAVYTGLGGFIAIHAMNLAGQGVWRVPLVLVPLVGGAAGLLCAALLGFVSTRKAGTPFSMITLGLGELVAAMALMFPEFFGGEGGITTNRVYGSAFMGITFGPAIQVYYLIAAYCFMGTAAMFAFTGTPLGRLLNAVRDNPERVEFIGYNPQRVRHLAFTMAGFFAGVGGALAAIHFEIVTGADSFSMARSGSYLLFTFLGGAAFFAGPIIGAVLLVLATVLLSEWSQAWLLYLGLVFLGMVMYAPGGVASLVMALVRLARRGQLRALVPACLALAGAALLALLGAACMIEMVYHLQRNAALGPQLTFLGATLDASALVSWLGAAGVLLTGAGLFALCQRQWARQWSQLQLGSTHTTPHTEEP